MCFRRATDGVTKLNDVITEDVIERLAKQLRNGHKRKHEVDEAIDLCGELYNIRTRISLDRTLLENIADLKV